MEESTRHRQHRCQTPPRECVARVGACPGAPRKKKPDYRSTSPQYLPPGRYQCYADYDERSPTNNNRNSNDLQDDIGAANNNLDDVTQQRSSATLMRRQAPPLHHHHHHHLMLVDIEPRRLFDNYHDDYSTSSVSRALYHDETTLGSDFFQLRLLNEDDEQNDAGRRNPVNDNDKDDQRTR